MADWNPSTLRMPTYEPATRLLARETIRGQVWDAFCRDDGILFACNDAGIATFRTSMNFLSDIAEHSIGIPNVITEPPVDMIEAYARKSVEIVTAKVALLVPIEWLTVPATKRLFEETPIVRIYVLTEPQIKRSGKLLYRKNQMAWVVWEKGSYDAPIFRML